ncbi:MAG: hypothetical protein HOJ34_09680 [Kordiimonadaceae bacterium]|nr:hypothetical protein [Kordiimonadaceae bacterium]MBT6036104.1 hypothetical protein [Kordiimonadaceae bacterium]MBT6330039.1 hypothetical protein [Kordiimonadaceae bacterium]
MSATEKVDALEQAMNQELDTRVVKPGICTTYGKEPRTPGNPDAKYFHMGHDPRLPLMSGKPTLVEFFEKRLAPANHLLQSGALALRSGLPETTVLACLLHDIGGGALLRTDHGYWGAQLVEPYVDEEVSWSIRHHQALRYFADEDMGYPYPEAYIRYFGEDFSPEPYIHEAAAYAKTHKWYKTARQICINDVYAFDPNVEVSLDMFYGIIERNFKQPEQGLGYDGSPSAHMWRSIIFPSNFL